MSGGGGGGFRGRGFGLHNHHRQGPNGPGNLGPNGPGNSGIRSSRNESPNSRISLPPVPGGRPNEHLSRSIGPSIRPDGQNARLGGTNFRGGTGTPHGPRPNFNLARRPPRHQIRPADNWAPRGGSPHYGNWRGGRPPRFNVSSRPFYRGRGHNFNNFTRFPYMGNNNMGTLGIDFPPIQDPKPATPHLGSEEERLQKITEAADELKRKLSAGPNDTDVWYNNDNEDDTAMDLESEEYESRIANKGIPELKHDPPELNLTLSDLRDIGRVDHDRTNEQTKTNVENVSDSSYEDTEVEILDYNPVETMIEIDIWSDDNYMEQDDDESPSSRSNEKTNKATETAETSEVSVTNVIQDKSATSNTLEVYITDSTDENVTHAAISNEANKQTKNGNEIIAEKEKRKDCEIEKHEEKRDEVRVKIEKMTEISKKITQDITVGNISLPHENLRIETQDHHREKVPEDNINCRQNEQRNKKEIIRDKKVEDERKKLECVNKIETLKCSSEKFVLKANEIQDERKREIRDDSESMIASSRLTDGLLNEKKSTKGSTAVGESKSDCSAPNEAPEKIAIAIVAKKTKALQKQTSRENCDDTIKTVSGFEVETENRRADTLLEIPLENSSSLPSDNEKSKARQEDEITKKSWSALISDGIQVRKKTSIDSRKDENREESKKEVKDSYIQKRNEQSEKLSNTTNSNGKTESREKTEISRRLDVARNTQNEKKIFDQRKSESLSSGDTKNYDDNKSSTTDNKTCERIKLVRKMPEGSAAMRNRKSSLAESIAKLQATMDYESRESSLVVTDRRGSSSSRPYPKKHYRNLAPIVQEPAINQQPPLIFDPRLSTQERTALLASGSLASASIPITQDFGMNHGYPPCQMANFVPNVGPMNYGAPPMVGGPVEAPICLSDPYAPMLGMTNMPTTIPLPAEATMMLQPPLPDEPPPPPPPPVKSNLDMVDELEDMQEAMEFAKKFMNMVDVPDVGVESEDSDFFHMPTFPNLPPIELPPLPPPDIPPPSAIPPPLEVPPPPVISKNIVSSARRSVLNEDSKKGSRPIKQEPFAHESEVIPDELRTSVKATAEEGSAFSDESNRQKIGLNLSPTTARPKRLEASQQKHEQRHNADERQPKSDLSTLSNDAAILSATKENTRVTNGPEIREITRTDEKLFNFNDTYFSQIRKSDEVLTNRHRSCSPSLSIRDKNSKNEESRSTPTYKEKSEQSLRRGIKDSSMKRTPDNPGTPESSWKNRVIGKFLKMSKNDICNMLNNTSLRKFDIAMKHLVKERRPSLSLGMRNNEEEKMKDADVSYDREEFMDQLSAMLDPSATVDVCNLPTQFIHHLNEVLQLDSMTDFEAALTPTDTTEIVSSTKSVQPSSSVSRAPRAPSINAKEIDDRRPAKRGRDKKPMNTCDNVIEATSVALTTATPPPISVPTTVARKLPARTCDDIVETRCAKNVENIVPETNTNRVTSVPGVRRRRPRTTSVEAQEPMTVNNGSTNRNETNSLNMADLDDIFSAGIVRERKKLSSVVVAPTNETRTTDFHLPLNTGNNEVMRDPSMDRVERAAVELDKIFTAGIARFKLPSTKPTTATSRGVETNDDDDDDENGNWNRDDKKSNLDSGHMRQRSICRFGTKSDMWGRRKVYEDRDAFRNLTKEEWEAKYGESSYTSYEQEYRAMVATRERKNDYESHTEIDDNIGVKSRLGNEIPADSSYDAWSVDDIGGRFRNVNDSVNYENNDYNRSSNESSSSSSLNSTSESSEDEAETDAVHKLLREIKAKEKIAKTKSVNEEIRDEVAAEIEKKRREREKLRKSRHKSRPKKTHRHKKDRRVRSKDKKRKERRKRKHRSRRSESDSSRSDSDYTDEEYMSSASRGRRPSRLLTENEIKKEVVVKDEPEPSSPPHLPRRSKSSLAIRLQDEARPPSRSSASSLPAVAVTSSTVPSTAANQPKTKAQLKQMPVVGKKSVSATALSDEIVKAQEIPVNAPIENAIKVNIASPLIAEVPPIISVPTKSSIPASTTLSVSSVQIQPTASFTEDTSSSSRPNSKKLDIKAYKERNRLRQIAETEKLRQINENPSILTKDLSTSLVRKNVAEITEDTAASVEQEKHSKLDVLEEVKSTIITTTTNTTIFSKSSSDLIAVCPTTIPLTMPSTTTSTLNNVSTTTSAPTIVSTTPSPAIIVSTTTNAAIIGSTTTNAAIIGSTTTNAAIIGSTTTSPAIIQSTTTSPAIVVSTTTSPRIASSLLSPREMISATSSVTGNLTAEAPKISALESTRSQVDPSRNVPPKKLIRRRSLTAAPKISVESVTAETSTEIGKFAHIKSEGRKEMKLREKPKKHRTRPLVEGLESTIPPVKPAGIRKRRSVSSDTTTDEGASLSEKTTEKDATILSQNAEKQTTKTLVKIKEEKLTEAPEKITEEQRTETPATITEKPVTHSSENIIKEEFIIPEDEITEKQSTVLSTNMNEENTAVLLETAQDSVIPSAKITEDSIVTVEKRLEEHAIISSENHTEETTEIPSKKVTEEETIVSSEKHAEEPMIVSSENSPKECAVINAEKCTEESLTFDSEKSPAESSANIEKESSEILQKSTEELAKNSEAIESNSKVSKVYKTGLKSDALPDTVPHEYFSIIQISKKVSVVIDSQSELETCDSPSTDLPEWRISSNPNEQLQDSNDDPPFRGFAKDAIILNDRVLTEAEGNITEFNDSRKVPLSFTNDDPDASPDEVLNLDDVTSTGVSLEAPRSYGDEEFVEEGVEIETSLLGFPVANDVTDVPEKIALGTDNDVEREDKSTEKMFIEESSRQSTDLITRVSPTLNDSPTPNDFLISNVQGQESVPSAILVTESIRDETNETPDLSPKDKVDEKDLRENTDVPRDDAAEVSASHEPENKEPVSTSVPQTTEFGGTMGSLQTTLSAGEKAIYNQMEKCKKISENKENQLPKMIGTEESNGEVCSTIDSLSNTPVDHVLTEFQRDQSNDAVHEANKETAEKTPIVEEERLEAKNKESNRGNSKSTTKEHSHNRNKKKSTRHRNHATKSDKKSSLTEKMVEEAISANIVKVVPKPMSKEWVLARMVEIDVEIHKLMNEKMTLYTMLQNDEFTTKDNRDEGSDNITKYEAKLSVKEETTISDIVPPTVLASHLARNLDKTPLITTAKKEETKKNISENDDKGKKRKKSPQRDIKHRGKESSETIENRRQQRNFETTRNISEKSSSSTEHDEADENRRKSKTKLLDSSKATRRPHEHSNKEDVREASRESTGRSGKSAKHEGSPKREKSKKKGSKTQPEPVKTEESTKTSNTTAVSKPTEKINSVIYSDESTWDSLDPETIQSDEKRGPKEGTTGSTGLALLEETLKREMAQNRKSKIVEKRKNKKQELRRVLLDASTFLTDEAEMAANEMRKNARKKGNTTSSTTKGKSLTGDTPSENPAKVWKHITSVIDAVAADRVEQLYTRESSSNSNDSTPTTSSSGRSVESAIAYERSPSISLTESTISEKSIKKSTAEESKKMQKRETDSIENENEEPEGSTKSKGSKKSKGKEKNYLSESKDSETSETATASERSSPVENPKKSRDVDTLNILTKTSTETKQEVKILGEKEENIKIKNESRSSKEKESEAQVAEASRSPSPDLPSDLSRSKSHEAKYRTKEKQKSESSNLKTESIEVSPEEDELINLSRKTDDERVRSHSRSDRTFKRRSMTPRDNERERKDKNSSRTEENNDHYEKSSGRSKSASKRRHEKSSINRSSKNSEDRSKRSRSKKRERERSNSRDDSPHDGESSRKRMHRSQRSSSPKIQSSLSDEQARRRGRKRKRRPEMSREDMMNCKVELIDCKYTYLSPEMHPRVLKKFGISRINPYVPPTPNTETVSPFEVTRIDTPSPPTLTKVDTPKEFIEETPGQPEEPESPEETEEIDNHQEANDRPDVDDVNETEPEDEDGTDETIHIVKVVENLQNAVISDQEEDGDAPEIIDDTSCPPDIAQPDVIAVEDETTDEMEAKNDTTDEVVVVEDNVSSADKPENQQESIDLEAEEDITYETRRTRYTVHKGPILDIKVLDDSFLAASEDGAIYRYSQTSNGILNIYKGHEAAVTCINVIETSDKRWNLYSGSLDGTCRCYDITTGAQDRLPADVGSPVQCMDQAWGVIFVGTKSGHISRYNIKSGSIKGDKLEFSDKSVLALKASSEGPRRVLIVASRNQPITIRDASTGLYLRTICGYKSHTVYSLMRERNLVYCGTSSTSIPVFDFTNGEQVTQYNAGVGIVCMRLYRQILFAGCYDGNIYVFDTKETKLIVSIPGPGNMLLSMEVVGDEIIAGSKDRQLHSWRMPRQVRALLAERT